VHGGVVSSAVLELFDTFSFKRKSTEEKLLLKRQKKVISKQKYINENRIRVPLLSYIQSKYNPFLPN